MNIFDRLNSWRGRVCDKLVDGPELRLVLGTGRSGTTWVADVLSATSTPLRYLSEPLYQWIPELKLSLENDHTAVRFGDVREQDHSLIDVYRSLAKPGMKWADHFTIDARFKVKRDDGNFRYCLVKEVHALLDVENIASNLGCPIVLISRDPLRIVDSILYNQGPDVTLWENEFTYLRHEAVMNYYFRGRTQVIRDAADEIELCSNREQIILKKIFCAFLLREIFRSVSSRLNNVEYIDYEDLCRSPVRILREIADFFGLEYESSIEPTLNHTMSETGEAYNPYSIFRNTKEKHCDQYKFLDQNDLRLASALINKLS